MAHLKILGISGSLRLNSSATMVLNQVAALMPDMVEFNTYSGLGDLPHFNDSGIEPPEVRQFKSLLSEADGVFICTPEYAYGVPGSLKNAIDWTVSSGEFVYKPVALIAAASVGKNAHHALLLTLGAITANVKEETTLLISFIRSKLETDGKIKDDATIEQVKKVVAAFIKNLQDGKRL